MKRFLREKVMNIANMIETLIAIILAISIAILVIYLIMDLKLVVINHSDLEVFNNYLASAFNLVIGIEFIKMLCKHTPDTVIEVLLFAIARQLIVEHTSTMETLIGIISIGILFATRKYLFYNFDEVDKTIYRGSEKIKRINLLEHIDIPYENKEDTLEDAILKEIEERNLEIGTGLCIYYPGFALRIAKIKDHVITRVEVIRSIKKK